MIFILNSNEVVVGTLARKGTTNQVTPYFDDKHIEDLSTGAETFTFSTFANTRQALNISIGNFIAFPIENGYKLFEIMEVTEEHEKEHIKTAYCEMAGIELINEIVRPVNLPSTNLKQFAKLILQDTEFEVGVIDDTLVEVLTIEIKENKKVYNLIQEYIIGKFGAEVSFRVEIEGGRIVGKYLDCFAERGEFKGLRFEYGKNVSKVKKQEDSTELVTALIGEGKNGTKFTNEVAEDKPKGQDWIGNEQSYQLYNKKGSHIFDVFKFDTESPAELLRETRKELERRCVPKLKYEVSIETLGQEVNLGDTVYIIDNDYYPPLHLSARVSKKETHKTDKNKDKVVLANYKEVVSRITDEDRDLASIIDERFPIKEGDISNGAVSSDKIKNDAIKENHIVKDSITTEHLKANSITSDKIEAGQIKAEHILADQIKTEHLKAKLIDATKIQAEAILTEHLKANQIEAQHIKADAIETDHIKAGQVVSDHILANQIKTEHLQANAITSDKILAGAITTEKLEADSVTADKILAGSIEADHIKTNAITTDKILANAITTDKLSANSVNADKIIANSILTKHIKADQVEANHIKANAITTDKILANAITSDKIGANQILATHIKAGSIDATKVTTGELITTSAQIKTGVIGSAHIGEAQITNAHISKGAIGDAQILEGTITSAKIGKGEIKSANIGQAQIETAHIKELSANTIKSGIINTGLIEVAGTNGNLKIKDNRLQVFDKSATPLERVSLGDVNGDGSIYGLRVRGADGTTILYDENGVYSEGITDGAITNPKIEENAVDSRVLNLKELFVEESAFINELQTAKLYASQLIVDEIRNDLINISGLITFDSLDPALNDLLFIKDPNDTDKTYINGNTILTNTIKASQIDLYNGLNVKKDGLDTFAVSKDGSVRVSGTIESFGFSNEEGNEKGYQLTPEGDAYLNDAIVRGSVILPNAGITNAEGVTDTVRFWAGASYEKRHEAPFRVYESGKIISTFGEFGGTFTGSLDIGNIHISDTNTTNAEFIINSNDDLEQKVRLTDSSAEFDVDFRIGDVFSANVQTKEVDFGKGVSIELTNGSNTVVYGKNDSTTYNIYDISTVSGGKHTLVSKNGYGGLSFTASGTQVTAGSETAYDYKFARASENEDVNVVIKGNLVVDKKITMADDNKIELVSVSGANSGIDFMIR